MVNFGCYFDWIWSQLRDIFECVLKCFREILVEGEDFFIF